MTDLAATDVSVFEAARAHAEEWPHDTRVDDFVSGAQWAAARQAEVIEAARCLIGTLEVIDSGQSLGVIDVHAPVEALRAAVATLPLPDQPQE